MAYHKEIHTYEEALEFAKSLDPQATVSQTYTDASVSEEIIYGETSFREWSAIIHGVECHVATICCNDPVGEFYTRTDYKLDTDYDYLVLQKIVSEKQPDRKMRYTDINGIYHDLLRVDTSHEENKKLSEDELEIAWEDAFEIYLEYSSHSVRKEAWFPVSIPVLISNTNDEKEYITYSVLVMKDFSEDGKVKFFREYKEAWDLMDSDLPIKK